LPNYLIKISTAHCILELRDGNRTLYRFPIGIGKPETPTPHGRFKIIDKRLNPGGIYGTRWLGISLDNYGIHGTNDPSSIHQALSHGCIRLYNRDIETLFSIINIGTVVIITS